EGKIDEIPIVGMVVAVAARKLQASRRAASIIFMRVMQREGGVHRGPGQGDRHGREPKLRQAVTDNAKLEDNGDDTGESTKRGEDRNQEATVVLANCIAADMPMPAAQHH